MTVTWRDTKAASENSGTTITVTKPTGTVDGDLLILQSVIGAISQSPIQGLQNWKEIPNTSVINGTLATRLYYRYASSEPADYTFTTLSSGAAFAVNITSFYGSGGANVAIDTYAIQLNASSTNREHPSITLSAAGLLACYTQCIQGSTADGAMTERYDTGSPRSYLMTQGGLSSGATGTRTSTGSAAASGAISLGLIEGPAKQFYGLHPVSFTEVVASSGAGTKTINKPTGVVDGDLMALVIAFTTDATPTLPSGWTLIEQSVSGSNTLRTYYKIASSEPSDYTITWTGTQTITLGIVAFRGFNGWPAQLITSDDSTNSSTTTHAYPALTPTQTNQLLVLIATYSSNPTMSPVQPNIKRLGYQSGATVISLFTEHLTSTSSTTGRTTISNGTPNSKVVSAIFAEVEPTPNAPTGLTVTAVGQNQIDLSWSISDPYAFTISIERSLDGLTGWTEVHTQAVGDTTYSDTGLATGTEYFYRLRSLVINVYSSYTSIESDTTYPGLQAPELVADAYHPRKILITISDPNVDSTGVIVEKSPNGVDTWTELVTLPHGTNTYDHTGRTPETTYYYRARAYKDV